MATASDIAVLKQPDQQAGPVTPVVMVGLLLSIMLVVWCIHLAVSYNDLRGQVIQNVTILVAVDSARSAVSGLTAEILGADGGAEPGQELQRLGDEREVLGRAKVESADAAVIDAVSDLEMQLQEVYEAAHMLVARDERDAEAFSLAASQLELQADQVLSVVRARQAELSEQLSQNWESLYVALIVSGLLAMAFAAVLVVRMRTAERRHSRDVAHLVESERRFRLLAENVPGVIYLCRNDERYTMLVLNDEVETLTGYPRQDFLEDRISFVELFHPDDAAEIPRTVDAALSQRIPFELKYRIKRRDGEWRWVEERGLGVFDGDHLEYLEGFINDVTESSLAEQELRQQRSYLRQVLDLNPSFIFAKDRSGRFTLANLALAAAYGTTVKELIGKTDADFNEQTDEVEHFREDDLRVLNTREPLTIPEEVVTDTEGNRRWFKTHKQAIIDEHNQANEVLGVAIDITDMKQAEIIKAGRNKVLERIATGKSLESILEMIAASVRFLDPTLCCAVILSDPASGELEIAASAGFDIQQQRRLQEIFAVTQMQGCREAMESGHRITMEDLTEVDPAPDCVAGLRAAGFRCCWIEPIESEAGEILGTIALFGTIPRLPGPPHVEMMESSAKIAGIATRRARAEAELRKSQERLRAADRLASIGTLTAGLGHDMNNVLFPLRCRLEAVDWSTQSADDNSLLVSVRDTVNYLQQLSDGLRLLATDPAQQASSTAATNIDEWWPQVRTLIQGALPERIRLEHNFPRGLPTVRAQPHQLTQAVLNLVVNAAEATDDASPVTVTARAADGGQMVILEVSDRGCGMTEDVKSHVLEPFFTTKKRGLSTGLGLSLVHGVAQSAGGHVDIESAPGRGTTVSLALPARQQAAQRDGTRREAVVSLHDARTSGWIKSLLESSGYNVRQALGVQPPAGALWVTEPNDENLALARLHRVRSPDATIIVFGDASAEWMELGVSSISADSDLSHIQQVVRQSQACTGGQNHEI